MALRCGRLFAVANTALLSQISTSILRRNLKRNLSKNLAKNLQKLSSYHIHGWEIWCTCCIANCPCSHQALQPDAPRWATHEAQQTKVLWLLPAQRSVKTSWVEFCWHRCFCGWIHCLFVLVITMLIYKTLKKKRIFSIKSTLAYSFFSLSLTLETSIGKKAKFASGAWQCSFRCCFCDAHCSSGEFDCCWSAEVFWLQKQSKVPTLN